MNRQFIEQLPIRTINFSDAADKASHDHIVKLVERMLELQKRVNDSGVSGNEKERLEQQIRNIDYEIDQEVYKLYGITKEEQRIIEESIK